MALMDGADQYHSGGGARSVYDEYRLGYTPSTKTVQDVWATVSRTFGDESGVQLAQADVIRWTNDAQDSVVNKNRILKARAFSWSIVGQAEYQYPSENIEQVESLWYDGQVLKGLSFTQAEQALVGIDRDTPGYPEWWTEWGGAFMLYPVPNDARQIVLFYTERPAPVATMSDPLSVPDKYFQAVVQYALQQAYEMDEDWAASQAKGQQFDRLTDALGEEERTSQRMVFQTRTLVDDGWD